MKGRDERAKGELIGRDTRDRVGLTRVRRNRCCPATSLDGEGLLLKNTQLLQEYTWQWTHDSKK